MERATQVELSLCTHGPSEGNLGYTASGLRWLPRQQSKKLNMQEDGVQSTSQRQMVTLLVLRDNNCVRLKAAQYENR